MEHITAPLQRSLGRFYLGKCPPPENHINPIMKPELWAKREVFNDKPTGTIVRQRIRIESYFLWHPIYSVHYLTTLYQLQMLVDEWSEEKIMHGELDIKGNGEIGLRVI
jgi:hypothetical protein